MKIPDSIFRIIILFFLLSPNGILYAQSSVEKKNTFLYLDTEKTTEERVRDLISRLTVEEKAVLLNHRGPLVERFNIKSDGWNQSLHGVWWNRPTTMFPVSIAMAATWDTKLIHEVATVISDEARGIYNGWHRDTSFPGEKRIDLPGSGYQRQPQSVLGPH